MPFAIATLFANAGEIWMIFGAAILIGSGVTFSLALPFLVLSFTNSFYRERLRQLLRLEGADAPPVLTPLTSPTAPV